MDLIEDDDFDGTDEEYDDLFDGDDDDLYDDDGAEKPVVVDECTCDGADEDEEESGHVKGCPRWRPNGWNELTADERGAWEDANLYQ